MYELIVIATIVVLICFYGSVGGYLAAKADIQHVHEALVWSYFWPYLTYRRWKNAKKKAN